MTKQELYSFFLNEHKTFKLENFFEKEETKKDNGALILITPNQMIFSRTLDKGTGIGSEYHEETKQLLTKVLYNIPLEYKEETTYEKDKENYLQQNQNIMLRMINETPVYFYGFCGNIKSIWIDFPKTITTTQLIFLKQLEKDYGEVLKQVSIKQEQEIFDKLIGFSNHQNQVMTDHTFKQAIDFAEKYLIDDSIEIIDEDIIIGKTINIVKQK